MGERAGEGGRNKKKVGPEWTHSVLEWTVCVCVVSVCMLRDAASGIGSGFARIARTTDTE